MHNLQTGLHVPTIISSDTHIYTNAYKINKYVSRMLLVHGFLQSGIWNSLWFTLLWHLSGVHLLCLWTSRDSLSVAGGAHPSKTMSILQTLWSGEHKHCGLSGWRDLKRVTGLFHIVKYGQPKLRPQWYCTVSLLRFGVVCLHHPAEG